MTVRYKTKPADALTGEEREAWRAFVDADRNLSSPYLALGFLDAMAAVRRDVEVVIQRRGGAIEAFFPFHRGLIGHARPLGGPLGDHHGVIAASGVDVELRALCAAARISAFDFHGAIGMQRAFAPHGALFDGSWVADLSEGMEPFAQRQKKCGGNTFRTLSKAPAKLVERLGEPVFRFHDDRQTTLDALLAWKTAQYKASGHFDVFSVQWTRKLLDRLKSGAAQDCRGVLSSLEVDGRLVAAHFGISGPRAMHYWFPAYDPALAKAAPGNALLMAILQQLAREGIGELHLGPGDYRYKAALGSWQIPLRVGAVTRPALSGLARRAAATIEKLAEAAPLGRVSHLPGKVFRRIDRIAGFHAAC